VSLSPVEKRRANCRVIALTRGLAFELKRARGGWLARVVQRPSHPNSKPGEKAGPVDVWAATEAELFETLRTTLLEQWPRTVGAPLGNRNARSAAVARRALAAEQEQRRARESGDDVVDNPQRREACAA
jgi:hypothetical protein